MGSINTPDFIKGFSVDDLQNGGMIQGKVGDEEVILARHSRLKVLPIRPSE